MVLRLLQFLSADARLFLRRLIVLAGQQTLVEQGAVAFALLFGELEPFLGLGHRGPRQLDFLGPRPGAQQLEPGLFLLDLGADFAQFRGTIAVRQPGQDVASVDPIAFIMQDFLQGALDLGPHVRVVNGQNGELTRHFKWEPPEPEHGAEAAENHNALAHSLQRAASFLPDQAQLCGEFYCRPADWSPEDAKKQEGEQDESPRLISLEKKTPGARRDEAQQPERIGAGQHAVDQVNAPLPGRGAI